MRNRRSSSPVELFISSTKMASTSSTNVNELLPGLESFLRSMLNSTHLDGDHRQIAAMYVDKLDQLTKPFNQQPQQTTILDDQSLINTDMISDDESDDFTDEEEEQRKKEFEEQRLQQQQQQSTPTVPRRSTTSENILYQSTRRQSSSGTSQWYLDAPKNTYLEALSPQLSNGHSDSLSSKTPSRLSISTPSSTILADGLLLTYDENQNWIWRYYVLDDFDLICFPADKKSLSTNPIQSDNDCSPLWVSDMSNAKVHTTVIDKIECLCLQIGLAEAIYVRPADPKHLNIWFKAFRDAASTQKSKDSSKGRRNVKTLSRNARRMFAQFNRKKGQIVSHLLDQMANVTGVDEKTRKHCELRGFLIVSLDNTNFVTKYCTIVDGIFRIHKSRLSDQTEHELCLNRCTLSFPDERTRDIQFALIDEQMGTIFIRGNNIYSMGRLLNTLAKYVEITGSSQFNFTSPGSGTSTPLSKHRSSSACSSQPHIYSDVDAASTITMNSQSNEIYSPSSVKSIPPPPPPPSALNIKATIYHNASKLHENDTDERTFVLPARRSKPESNPTSPQQVSAITNVTYDQPKSYDNVAVMSTSVDRNNNHVLIPPQRYDKVKNPDDKSQFESRSSRKLTGHFQRSKSKSSHSNERSSSPENTVFCLRSSDSSSSSQHRNSRRRRPPNPISSRPATHTTPTDYVNKLANLFSKNFSTSSPIKQSSISDEHHISTQTYDTVPSPSSSSTRSNRLNHISLSKTADDLCLSLKETPAISKRVYDIPITIERPTKCIVTPFEQYQKPTIGNSRSIEPISSFSTTKPADEEATYSQGYDNLSKNDGIGKFRFVVPFNHSPNSAFVSSNLTIKPINSPTSSSSSSFSTIRPTSSSNKNSNTRSTLMTAV